MIFNVLCVFCPTVEYFLDRPRMISNHIQLITCNPVFSISSLQTEMSSLNGISESASAFSLARPNMAIVDGDKTCNF